MGRRSRARVVAAALLFFGNALESAAVEKITVLGLFKDKAIVEIDGARRVLEAGQTSPEGVTLVSADSEQALLEVDGAPRSYRLGTHIGTTFAAPREGPAIHIWPDRQGMYNLVGSINGYPVDFLVDTGASSVAMNKHQARRLGIDYLVEGTEDRVTTASGIATSYRITLARVKVGEIELRDVEATVIDGDFPSEVLLGNSFLGRLQMRREGRMMELRKRI